jgi:hypothetical protein
VDTGFQHLTHGNCHENLREGWVLSRLPYLPRCQLALKLLAERDGHPGCAGLRVCCLGTA